MGSKLLITAVFSFTSTKHWYGAFSLEWEKAWKHDNTRLFLFI